MPRTRPFAKSILCSRTVVAISGAVWLFAVGSASAVPRSLEQWLGLLKSRRQHAATLVLESDWRWKQNGRAIEEWKQFLKVDELGRRCIENQSRTLYDPERPGVAVLMDTVYAFNGLEYRELTKAWEYGARRGLADQAKRELRATPPKSLSGRILSEPDEGAELNLTPTPLRMADYWFSVCVINAAAEGIEPQTTAVEGRPGRWQVALESKQAPFGHKCRAVIDESQDSRATEIDLWDHGRLIDRHECNYVEHEGRWLPSSGVEYMLRPNATGGAKVARELRFSVVKASIGRQLDEAEFLPAFPIGTQVWDARSESYYRLGDSREADGRMADLVQRGDRAAAALRVANAQADRWYSKAPKGLALTLTGLVVGGLAKRIWKAVGQVRSPKQGTDG